MFNRKLWMSLITSIGFFIGLTTHSVIAQVPDPKIPSVSHNSTHNQPFYPSPQDVITLSGLALIALELWYFLGNKSKGQKAETNGDIQEMTITVDGGYEPSRVVVDVNKPVRLNFLRRDLNSCLDQVLLPDFQIAQELEMAQITSIEFTPQTPGQYTFTCGMSMFRGVVEVVA